MNFFKIIVSLFLFFYFVQIATNQEESKKEPVKNHFFQDSNHAESVSGQENLQYKNLLEKGLEGSQNIGKRLRNLLLVCPGLSGHEEFKKKIHAEIKPRVLAIEASVKNRLEELIGDKNISDAVLSSEMPKNWSGSEWSFSKQWSDYLNTLKPLKRMEILENLYNWSLTQLSLQEGMANISIHGKDWPLQGANFKNEANLKNDRLQALWIFRSLNTDLAFDESYSPSAINLAQSQRNEADLFKEMKYRIDWTQNDPSRPPFGNTWFSCGMNCNSHFVEAIDEKLGMQCHTIKRSESYSMQLDRIETTEEFYKFNEILPQ